MWKINRSRAAHSALSRDRLLQQRPRPPDHAIMWSSVALLWMLFGVLAGAVFGVAGGCARAAGWRQIVGGAMPAAVLFAEAAVWARRAGSPSYGANALWSVAINAVLGVLVIVLVARTSRQQALALASALPLAPLGFVSFTLAGFA